MTKHLKAILFASSAILFSAPSYAQQGTVIGGGTSSVSCGPGITGCPSGPLSPTQALGNSGAAITGTTYTVDLTNNITTSDLARELVFTGSGASAWTLGTGSNGMGFDVVNRGTADITITATGNINGNSTLVIQPGLSANIFFGNSTWNAFNIPIASSSQFGAMKPDNSTITCTGGVCSSSGGGGGGGVSYAYVPNAWMFAEPLGVIFGAGSAPAANTIIFEPFNVTSTMTPSDFALFVTTTSAGGNAQVAIYANSTSWIGPTGSALIVSNNISTASANGAAAGGLTTSAQLAPGIYWRATNHDNSTAIFKSYTNNLAGQNIIAGTDSIAHLVANSTATGTKITLASTFGTWPTISGSGSFTYAAAGSNVPAVMMKIGSVP